MQRVRAFLMVSASMIAGAILLTAAGRTLFSYTSMRLDPYPTFMSDYQLGGSRSYEEAKRTFSDFVAKAFPIGSDENKAIAQITGGGFHVVTTASDSIELVRKRRAGPCNETYLILLTGDGNGRIARIVGQLQPICLASAWRSEEVASRSP